MAILLPQISNNNIGYRIPDSLYSSVPPAINEVNFFITPTQKQFYFKTDNGTVTQVNIDFIGKDCLYKINGMYKAVQSRPNSTQNLQTQNTNNGSTANMLFM